MREAVIVSAVRTAVGKAPRGTLRSTRPDDLAAIAIRGALDRVPSLDAKEVEDVILGCAFPEAEQGMNFARLASFRAGVPITAGGMTVNRYCASGLQTIALAAERIRGGGADCIVAGGAEHELRSLRWQQGEREPVAAGQLAGLLPFDGADRRAGGEALRNHPRRK
jgi:acetyl-CoA acyltransferase